MRSGTPATICLGVSAIQGLQPARKGPTLDVPSTTCSQRRFSFMNGTTESSEAALDIKAYSLFMTPVKRSCDRSSTSSLLIG